MTERTSEEAREVLVFPMPGRSPAPKTALGFIGAPSTLPSDNLGAVEGDLRGDRAEFYGCLLLDLLQAVGVGVRKGVAEQAMECPA